MRRSWNRSKAIGEAVGHDLERSRGRWYPKLDVQAGGGTDAYSSELTRDSEEDNDWDGRTEASVSLRQRLYDGGEASSQIRLDETRLSSLEFRVFDNAESLALDAIIATLEVYRQRRLRSFWPRRTPRRTGKSWPPCRSGPRPEPEASPT